MNRYAIIIGVEKYTHFSPTAFAHADCRLIRETLTQYCDYPEQHTILLQLAPDADKKPDEILADIRRVVAGLQSGDTVFFYFAGHGDVIENRPYLILPNSLPDAYERTALALDDIANELRPPERICFRVFDACHSGTDVRGGSRDPDTQGFVRAVTNDPSGWVTLAACRGDQVSTGDPSLNQGVFTHYFCDYIRNLKPGEPVLPELVKVDITPKVSEHARRLGYTQTPTLNASISGNVSLAVRRTLSPAKESADISPDSPPGVLDSIAHLRTIPSMFEPQNLESFLRALIDAAKDQFGRANEFGSTVSIGEPIYADEIPEDMQPSVVNFSINQGLSSRHDIARWEEKHENPYMAWSLGIARQYTVVRYRIKQSQDLPRSAALLQILGDGRCVPQTTVLLYLIPLQLTACLLASSFVQRWPPYGAEIQLLCHSYQIHKPSDQIRNNVEQLIPFAVKRTNAELRKVVVARVQQLEKELQG